MARVELDHDGIRELLRGDEVRAVLREAAHEVAAVARARRLRAEDGTPLPIEVRDERDTDRAGVSVAVPHPAGVGMEARHGVLRRAAEAVGLEPTGLGDEDGR